MAGIDDADYLQHRTNGAIVLRKPNWLKFSSIALILCAGLPFWFMARTLALGEITLATRDASNTYQMATQPTGFWVVFGLYAMAAGTALTLGILGVRQRNS